MHTSRCFNSETQFVAGPAAVKRPVIRLLLVPLRPPEQRVSRRAVSGFSCPGWRWRRRLRLLLFCLMVFIFKVICWAAVIVSGGVKLTTRTRHTAVTVGGVCSGHAGTFSVTAFPALIKNINRGYFFQGVQPAQGHHGSRGGAFGLAESRAARGIGRLWHSFLVIWDEKRK